MQSQKKKECIYYYDSDSNGENGSEKENWVHNLDLLSRSDESDEEIFVSKLDLTPNKVFGKVKVVDGAYYANKSYD